jgi:hypothetical protein
MDKQIMIEYLQNVIDELNIDKQLMTESIQRVIDKLKKSEENENRYELRFWDKGRSIEADYVYPSFELAMVQFTYSLNTWRNMEIFDRLENKVMTSYINKYNSKYMDSCYD